jgi:GNAT superfamily N-acetyltransferase
MARFTVRELGPRAWPDFAKVVEKHNGVWGGCWCVVLHDPKGKGTGSAAGNKAMKEKLVMEGKSQSALVYDGQDMVGWCLFGPPAEVPGRMSAYGRLGLAQPDWRIPCFFVDRDRRKEGVAKAALAGALRMIAKKGGGVVDAYPLDVQRKPYGSSFLSAGTSTMFARAGFRPVAKLGAIKLVMRRVVRGR